MHETEHLFSAGFDSGPHGGGEGGGAPLRGASSEFKVPGSKLGDTSCVTRLQEFSEPANYCIPFRPFQRTIAREGEAGIKPKPSVSVA